MDQPVNEPGAEIMAANWLLEEAGVPATNSQRLLVAQCIRYLAREGGTVKDAADFILEKARSAEKGGERVTVWWFTDRKYLPQQTKKTARQKRIEEWSPADD